MPSIKKSLVGLISLGAVALSAGSALAGGPDDARWGYGSGYSRWSGPYIGAHIGGAWSDSTITDSDGYAAGAPAGTHTNVSASGAFGGAQLGYNWQAGMFVYGLEGDIGYMNLNEDRLLTGSASGTRVGIDSGVYGDVTARLGIAFDRALIYAKGGWAFYNGDEQFSTVSGSFSHKSDTDTFSGWTAGGGIEYLIGPAWSLKVEYQHFDFGSQDFTVFNAGNTPFRFKEDLSVDTVKVGLNIKLGGRDREHEPLK